MGRTIRRASMVLQEDGGRRNRSILNSFPRSGKAFAEWNSEADEEAHDRRTDGYYKR